jgi:hypothetical protein
LTQKKAWQNWWKKLHPEDDGYQYTAVEVYFKNQLDGDAGKKLVTQLISQVKDFEEFKPFLEKAFIEFSKKMLWDQAINATETLEAIQGIDRRDFYRDEKNFEGLPSMYAILREYEGSRLTLEEIDDYYNEDADDGGDYDDDNDDNDDNE